MSIISKSTKVLFIITDVFAWIFIGSGFFSIGYLVLMDETELSYLSEQFSVRNPGFQIALITFQSIGFYLITRRKFLGLTAAIAPSVVLYLPEPTLEGLLYLLTLIIFFTLPWFLSYLDFYKRSTLSKQNLK